MKEFILKAVKSHPKDLVSYVAKHFGVTPQAVHKHLGGLVADGLIKKTGETRSTIYEVTPLGEILRDKPQRKLGQLLIEDPSSIQEDVVWRENFKGIFSVFPKNVKEVCEYGFTEILNNAKDHAEAKQVWIFLELNGTTIDITIHDDGVGIFKKIREALNLGTQRESILHLSKGKFTTDPDNHTGEGIFFSSRSFDRFHISTPNLAFVCRRGDDWLLDKDTSQQYSEGTWITMQIDVFSTTKLQDVFKKFTVDSGVPVFEKTHIVVKLGLLDEETFVSRSQAKRILLGLEKFKEVLLDFRGIPQIGPSFADEIFRVFQLRHPDIRLIPVNTDPDVDMIIKRALMNLKQSK